MPDATEAAVERIMALVYTQAEIAWQHPQHDKWSECKRCDAHMRYVAEAIRKELEAAEASDTGIAEGPP